MSDKALFLIFGDVILGTSSEAAYSNRPPHMEKLDQYVYQPNYIQKSVLVFIPLFPSKQGSIRREYVFHNEDRHYFPQQKPLRVFAVNREPVSLIDRPL